MLLPLQNLHFRLRANVLFGANSVDDLGSVLTERSWRRIVLVTDPGLQDSGLLAPILEGLRGHGVYVEVFDGVEPNPKDATVEEAKEMVVDREAEAVVGMGGGSCLDAAKAAAMLVTNDGAARDYDGTNQVEHDPLPTVAIPTTAGTGSEVTANVAITDSASKTKMSIRSPKLVPDLSVLDPRLLRSIPPFVCATSGIDALTHAIEGYLSNRATTFTDMVALDAVRILSTSIRPFYANPAHEDYAASMLYGSMLAGLVVSDTGTGNAHALARAVGGEYDVPHGHACAVFLPPVLRFNALARPKKFAKLAEAMFNGSCGHRGSISSRHAAGLVADEIDLLLDDLRVPKHLEGYRLSESTFDQLAGIALANTGPNPRKTTYEDLSTFLKDVCREGERTELSGIRT